MIHADFWFLMNTRVKCILKQNLVSLSKFSIFTLNNKMTKFSSVTEYEIFCNHDQCLPDVFSGLSDLVFCCYGVERASWGCSVVRWGPLASPSFNCWQSQTYLYHCLPAHLLCQVRCNSCSCIPHALSLCTGPSAHGHRFQHQAFFVQCT